MQHVPVQCAAEHATIIEKKPLNKKNASILASAPASWGHAGFATRTCRTAGVELLGGHELALATCGRAQDVTVTAELRWHCLEKSALSAVQALGQLDRCGGGPRRGAVQATCSFLGVPVPKNLGLLRTVRGPDTLPSWLCSSRTMQKTAGDS